MNSSELRKKLKEAMEMLDSIDDPNTPVKVFMNGREWVEINPDNVPWLTAFCNMVEDKAIQRK